MRVKDERLQRRIEWSARRRDALHERLQDLWDPLPLFRRREDHLFAWDRERLLQLVHHRLRVRGGEVDLVEYRDDDESHLHGQVHVGERLRLNPLARVHHKDCAVAGLQAARDFVSKVHMPRRVDQVEPVVQPVSRHVLKAHRARLDRDPLLALKVHGVEHLRGHLARIDGVGGLQQPVGERGLAVVNVRDDAEVAQSGLGDVTHIPSRIARRGTCRRSPPYLPAEPPPGWASEGLPSATIARRLALSP